MPATTAAHAEKATPVLAIIMCVAVKATEYVADSTPCTICCKKG